MRKLRSVQVLRGVAALAVVALHSRTNIFLGSAPGDFYWGAAGVDLFFVISGFIIGSIAPGQEPAAFLKRRAWRIYPMWIIAAATYSVVLRPSLSAGRFAATLTLWPVWGHFQLPAPSIGWTLCFEMLFYAGAALALRTRPFIPFAIFAAALALAPTVHSNVLGFIGNPMIFEFMLGLAISRLPRSESLAAPAIGIGAAALIFSPVSALDWTLAMNPATAMGRIVFWGLPAAAAVYGALSLERRFASRFWNLPAFLGDASYSIYLFHLCVVKALAVPWWAKDILATATGCAAYLLIERHLMQFRFKAALRPQTDRTQRRLRPLNRPTAP